MNIRITESKFSVVLDKLINRHISDSGIIETYKILRRRFQTEGWTEKDLEKPPYYPTDVMSYYSKIQRLKKELIYDLSLMLGNKIDENMINNYVADRFRQIDIEIPLKDGNIKRNNSRNEDY